MCNCSSNCLSSIYISLLIIEKIMTKLNSIAKNFIKKLKEPNNKLNIYLIIITIALAIINILFLKKLELGILTIIFNNHFNDFLGGILILAYINICLSFINKEIKSLIYLIATILLISFVWEYLAIFIKPHSVFDYLDIFAYIFGSIVYWLIINRFFKQ